MNTKEMFSKNRVTFDLKAKDKMGAIDELIALLAADGKVMK